MSDSAFHVFLAGIFFVTGFLLTFLSASIALRIRHTWWTDASRKLFVRVTRAIPKGWARKEEHLYEGASMEKSIRWYGFILLAGALLQLWAAVLMKSSF
jgi:hypothetical protein